MIPIPVARLRPAAMAGCCCLALIAAASCNKAQKLAELAGKSAAPTAPAPPHAGPLVSELTAADYPGFPNKPGRVAIVDFHAHWCGPCRKLGPILEEIAREHGGLVLVGKVNVDQCQEIARREGVQGIPDVRIYRDGKLVDKFVGLPPASQVRALVAKHTAGLSLAPAAQPATAAPPPAGQKPALTPADKDWLPAGMQRR